MQNSVFGSLTANSDSSEMRVKGHRGCFVHVSGTFGGGVGKQFVALGFLDLALRQALEIWKSELRN